MSSSLAAAGEAPPMPPGFDPSLQGADLLTVADLGAKQLHHLLELAAWLKAQQRAGRSHRLLEGRSLAMIFEKSSLRTRTTFEVGMIQLGGHAVDLAGEHLQMGVRESVPDVARNLDRWVDAIMARVYKHGTLLSLAEWARVPVINGLSDLSHPCQIIADLMTIQEQKGHLRGLKLAYVGDGFNVAHSLLLAAGVLGLDLLVATPPGYEPRDEVVLQARALGRESGAEIAVGTSASAAARDADVIYTDSWVSMGQEDEAADRLAVFPPFQVNAALVAQAAPDAIVMHCLPAHRGQEVTDEVLDGAHSVVFDQAENRLHAQKAILASLIPVGAGA